MAKCNGCGKFISPAEAVKCDNCKLMYHRACVCIPSKFTITSPWHCPECKKNVVRDNAVDTPVRGRAHDAPDFTSRGDLVAADPDLMFDIKTEFKNLKEDFFNKLQSEFQTLRDDMVNLKSSLQTCCDRMSSLEERVIILENQTKSQSVSTTDVDNIIAQLKADLNERDQELLSNDIEISNLPEQNGENPNHLAMLVATKIGLKLETRDIVHSHRVGLKSMIAKSGIGQEAARPRHLIVRLARRDLRDEMLRCARVRREVTTSDLDMADPPKRFFINERLTKFNRQLFRKARDAADHFRWKYVWTKQGHILVRKNAGDRAHRIRTETDISDVISSSNNQTV